MRRGLVAGVAAWGLASSASAQDVPVDSAVEINLFDPAVGPHSFLTVSGAEVMGHKQFTVGFYTSYLTNPFTVYNVTGYEMDEIAGARTRVVERFLGGHITGAYGWRDEFQVSAVLPIVFQMAGDGLDPGTGNKAMEPLDVSGFGDTRVDFAWRFAERGPFTFAAIPGITIPTSTKLAGENAWLGDDLPSFRPRAAAEWTSADGLVSAGANLGLILRKPREVYSSVIGQQLTYGVAAALHAHPRIDAVIEVFGRKGFSADVDESPLELDGAFKFAATPTLGIAVGGGAGVLRGIGSPSSRFFAAVTWTPDFRDNDGDGIQNQKDKCPFQREDVDGFQDEDGCVDDDNDEDFLADRDDKCPNQAEDKDGFDDDDGCPELDNDRDGFADDQDQCPTDAEDKLPPTIDDGCPATKKDSDDDGVMDSADKCPHDQEDTDGFEDEDGCPEADNDTDGAKDESDQCPTVAEDADGFQDEDGCPEADNDLDGFADAEDKCPSDPEFVNGVADWDGCPDKGGKILARLEGDKVLFTQGIEFGRRDEVKLDSKLILDQAALVMRSEGARGVTKWRIVVAAARKKGESDDALRARSQKQAEAIKEHFVAKGIDAASIEAIGAVSDNPTAIVVALERSSTPPEGETVEEEAASTPEP